MFVFDSTPPNFTWSFPFPLEECYWEGENSKARENPETRASPSPQKASQALALRPENHQDAGRQMKIMSLEWPIMEVYHASQSSFEEIAKNPNQLDLFLERLCALKAKRVAEVLGLFAKESYETPVHLSLTEASELGNVPKKFPNLQGLTLRKMPLSDKELRAITAQLPKMRELQLTSCPHLTPEVLVGADFVKRLRVIAIENIQFDDGSLYSVIRCASLLVKIALKFLPNVTFEDFENLPIGPQVEEFLAERTGITDEGLLQVCRLFPNVKLLQLIDNKNITPAGFKNAPFSKSIELLDLSGSNIDNVALYVDIARLTNLRSLGLHHCRRLTDWIFSELKLPVDIQVLVLDGTSVTAVGLQQIFRRCSKLENVAINDCRHIHRLEFPELEIPETVEELFARRTHIDAKGAYHLIDSVRSMARINFVGCRNLPKRCRIEATGAKMEKLLPAINEDIEYRQPKKVAEAIEHLAIFDSDI